MIEFMEKKDCDLPLIPIERRIYIVRETQVMIDLDLASLYGVENRALRQAVRRNQDSFPEDFMFRLTQIESNTLITNGVSQFVIPRGYNTGGSGMYAFTEQGVAMLATILKSAKARAVSIEIMRAFVAMRRFLAANAEVFQRSHDRFLIIDERVYHVGASLKDLGKKWFAVSLMEALDAGEMLSRLQNLV